VLKRTSGPEEGFPTVQVRSRCHFGSVIEQIEKHPPLTGTTEQGRGEKAKMRLAHVLGMLVSRWKKKKDHA